MENKLQRFVTFGNLGVYSVHPFRLADAGFYYEKQSDEVKCFACDLEHKGWSTDDDPLQVHLLLSPGCTFIKTHPSLKKKYPLETCEDRPSWNIDSQCDKDHGNHQDTEFSQTTGAMNKNSPLITTKSAIRPKYQFKDISSGRQTTFVDSSRGVRPQPSDFCEAGFFYEGFVSGFDLMDSKPEYDIYPCTDNARCCAFMRGDNFVSCTPADMRNGKVNNTKSSISEQRRQNSKINGSMNMNDPAILSVIDMGYSPHIVRTALLRLKGRNVERTSLAETLLRTIWELEESDETRKSYQREQADPRGHTHYIRDTSERARDDFTLISADSICGFDLMDWEPEDNTGPWKENKRWSPNCRILREYIGDNFVSGTPANKRNGKVNYTKSSITEQRVQNSKMNGSMNMNDPAILSVIDMEYSPYIVRKALLRLKGRNVERTSLAEKLLQTIWELEESDETRKSYQREQTGPSGQTYFIRDTSERTFDDVTPISADLLAAVEKENKEIKDMRSCKVCFDDDASIVFLPCGHLGACAFCAFALKYCPVCSLYVIGNVRVILSPYC